MKVVAVVQAAPDLQIFLLVEGIPDLLHGIIIRLDQYIFIVGAHPVMVGKKPACQQGFILIGAHAPELGIHLLVADDQADVIAVAEKFQIALEIVLLVGIWQIIGIDAAYIP